MRRVALLGGLYSNYLALERALADIRGRGADAIFCLGDMGAFGPYPDRVFPLLFDAGVECLQGNYDHSIGNGLSDCQCGYLDPRDNHFAQISYDYTLANTTDSHREWLRSLPPRRVISLGDKKVLLCHGSPRRVNEFLWESTTSSQFLESLASAENADAICVTHTGIKWQRKLNRGLFVNVGVLGRPENDGNTCVWYTMLTVDPDGEMRAEFVPVVYDHVRLADEMRAEKLPDEFIETVRTGWWTTCLEILPSKERRRGRY